MAISRSEALDKIDGHRRAIREHIDKIEAYAHDYDKDYAEKTVHRVQREIQSLKERCSSHIPDSWEDAWRR